MDDDQDLVDIKVKRAQFQLEHDDFHSAIEAMIAQRCDPLQIQRMKKKKLELKDRINALASKSIPDIIA